mmetsp:Transcript_9331/g.27296  ORF Transcript_9331/g.27296 Transcript_9331/m.27296 type:complete len:577 (+) Transcript_9331:100-1830(+)
MSSHAEGEVWEGGGKRYRMEKVVGNGAFGIVWRAKDLESGMQVAIKKVILDRRYHNRELEMMRQLDHDCVIKLLNHFEKTGRKPDETCLHLVMDYMPDTIRSVAMSFQKQRVHFPADDVSVYLYQALRALEYVHGLRICHRDLKPDNFLVDPARRRLKLIDFGCAKMLVRGQPNVSYICSRYYRAPELLFGATEYSCAVDMWSIGTILTELLLGHLPFQGQDSTQQHLVEILKLLGTPTDRELRSMGSSCSAADLPTLRAYPWERVFPANTSQRAIDLAYRLLCLDPAQRLSASQALAHPFFDGVQYLLPDTAHPDGAGGARVPSSHAKWQKTLHRLFDAYVAARSSAVQAALPSLERSLAEKVAAKNGGGASLDARLEAAKTDLEPRLAALKQSECEAMQSLAQAVLTSVAGEPAAAAAPASAAGSGEASAARCAELQSEIAKQQAAVEARDAELASLRSQLSRLQREVAERDGGGGTSGRRAIGVGGGPQAQATPAPRVASAAEGASGCHGAEVSPLYARASSLGAEGLDSGATPRGNGLRGIPTDNLGRMTPLGLAHNSSGSGADLSERTGER